MKYKSVRLVSTTAVNIIPNVLKQKMVIDVSAIVIMKEHIVKRKSINAEMSTASQVSYFL